MKFNNISITLGKQPFVRVGHFKQVFIRAAETEECAIPAKITLYGFGLFPSFHHNDPDSVPEPLTCKIHEPFHVSNSVIVDPASHNFINLVNCDRDRNRSGFSTACGRPEF